MSDFMRRALEQAEKAYELREVPVGAVLVSRQGEILSARHNLSNASQNPLAHCERLCFADVTNLEKLQDAVLYVTVEPCSMCIHICKKHQLAKIVYGCNNPKFGGTVSIHNSEAINRRLLQFCHRHQVETCLDQPAKKIEIEGGVLEAEAIDILKKFFSRGNTRLPVEMRHRKK